MKEVKVTDFYAHEIRMWVAIFVRQANIECLKYKGYFSVQTPRQNKAM